MALSKSIKTSIAVIALLFAIGIVLIFFYDDIFMSAEPGKSTAVHALLSKDVINTSLTKGQSMRFSKGALICDELESIKNYFTYLNAGSLRRITGISQLFISGSCSFSTTPRAESVILDVKGLFIKARWTDDGEVSTAWIIYTELYK